MWSGALDSSGLLRSHPMAFLASPITNILIYTPKHTYFTFYTCLYTIILLQVATDADLEESRKRHLHAQKLDNASESRRGTQKRNNSGRWNGNGGNKGKGKGKGKESQNNKNNGRVNGDGVTLVTAAWTSELMDGSLNSMLDAWDGPKVVVVARLGKKTGPVGPDLDQDLKAPILPRSDVTVIEVDLGSCSRFLKGNKGNSNKEEKGYSNKEDKENKILPSNMLMNIGLDVAATDVVFSCPKGYIPRLHSEAGEENPGKAV